MARDNRSLSDRQQRQEGQTRRFRACQLNLLEPVKSLMQRQQTIADRIEAFIQNGLMSQLRHQVSIAC
jgi:hypothetical protein